MKGIIAMGIMVLLVASIAGAEEIYKWVDENGTVHYTNTPPPQKSIEDIETLQEQTGQPSSTQTQPRVPSTVAVQTQVEEQFSGSGQQVTRKFSLTPGLHIFKMKHNGQSNFIIRPMSTDGRRYSTLVNEIGRFDGSAVFTTEKTNTYLLNVDADGTWSVSIQQPQKDPLLRNITGRGQQVTKLITLENGLYLFKMNHSGQSNFIIKPYSSSGRGYSSLVNEIGPFDGSSAEAFSKGDYLFQVYADGVWEIAIQKQ
jgi:hypothetical protein